MPSARYYRQPDGEKMMDRATSWLPIMVLPRATYANHWMRGGSYAAAAEKAISAFADQHRRHAAGARKSAAAGIGTNLLLVAHPTITMVDMSMSMFSYAC